MRFLILNSAKKREHSNAKRTGEYANVRECSTVIC